MMADVMSALLQLTGLWLVASAGVGLICDHVDANPWRDALIGLLFGCLSGVAIWCAITLPGGLIVDARLPLLAIAGLIGGPIGALAALPLPIVLRIEAGGAVAVGLASIVFGALLGASVREIRRRLEKPLTRAAVVWTAAASPLVFLCFVFGSDLIAGMVFDIIVPLVLFNAAGILLLGMSSLSEMTRAEARRHAGQREAFDARTNLVPERVFDSQLLHWWKLHVTFDTAHAFLLVSLDDAAALKRTKGRRAYERLRTELAKSVSSSIRRTDIATARDFDRFAVLLPQSDMATARAVARRIQATARLAVEATDGALTVSVGLAEAAGSVRAGDIEAAAEGALFLANAKDGAGAIGPDARADLVRDLIAPPDPASMDAALHANWIFARAALHETIEESCRPLAHYRPGTASAA